jgi:hypothetical protein
MDNFLQMPLSVDIWTLPDWRKTQADNLLIYIVPPRTARGFLEDLS